MAGSVWITLLWNAVSLSGLRLDRTPRTGLLLRRGTADDSLHLDLPYAVWVINYAEILEFQHLAKKLRNEPPAVGRHESFTACGDPRPGLPLRSFDFSQAGSLILDVTLGTE